MAAKYLIISLAVTIFAGMVGAQNPTASPQSNPIFTSSVDILTPTQQGKLLVLQSHRVVEPIQPGTTASVAKECPMPVHRPDTSGLERMQVERPSPNVSYSMPTAEVRCPNPLDRTK
jgi:hypothetical protein